MANREKATKFIVDNIDAILPGSENTGLWKKRLEAMSNAEFDAFMTRLENGEDILSITVPNLGDKRLSVERNLDLADKLGHNFFEHLMLTDPDTGVTYKTPIPYLVVDLPLRRQVQSLMKKISVSEHNGKIDEMTGQRAYSSETKGSKLSFPEIQILYAHGLQKSILEMIKYRGGDEQGYRAMDRAILETGGVSLDSLADIPTQTKSVLTLSTFLKAMHLDNTL